MRKNSKDRSLSGNKHGKAWTIIILSDRCVNIVYQQICYLDLDLFTKPCYFISMIFRL